MKYTSESIDIILKELLPEHVDRYKVNLKTNVEQQEQMLQQALTCIDYARQNDIYPTNKIWNDAGFIMMISMDLKTTLRNIVITDNEWMRRLYARQACLIIYESINDIFELLGKEFRDIIKGIFDHTSLESIFRNIRTELNSFKNEYQTFTKEVRNMSIAHKDHDIKLQIEQIQSLSLAKLIKMIVEFDKILNSIGNALQTLINEDLERLKYENQL